MIKTIRKLLSVCLASLLIMSCACAWAQEAAPLAEWTVLLYMCGTDLESNGASATENLLEIALTQPNDQVNLVLQTGGARAWHTSEIFDGWDVETELLERYHYDAQGFSLDEQLPLANMASAETLTDFIRWGAANYPAKKTMLLLWDHGGGSFGGIISDELHRGSVMSIEDLGRALRTAGVPFEALVFDACLMASLETAQMVEPSVHYLIASEESVSSKGSNYFGWLQYLYDHPSCDGGEFGTAFCDAIVEKYEDSEASSKTLTFSTIDLTKIGAVGKAFNAFFAELGKTLQTPRNFRNFVYDTQMAQTYEMPEMIDLADMASRIKPGYLSQETVDAVIRAVDEAVVYEVKGSARSYSNGLSFYYAPQSDVNRLDHYARCCPSAEYLAFLDVANIGWTAPEWVYEQTERLEDIKRKDYVIELETTINEYGLPLLQITNAPGAAAMVNAQVFLLDDNDEAVLLGTDTAVSADFGANAFIYQFIGEWLSIGGEYCPLTVKTEQENHTLYGIPFILADGIDEYNQTGSSYELRAALVYDDTISEMAQAAEAEGTFMNVEGSYELYGIWNNVNTSDSLPSRDVWDISLIDGNRILFLYPTLNPYTGEYGLRQVSGAVKFNSTKTSLAKSKLPSGNYGFAYVVQDVFGNEYRSAPIQINWNGKEAVYSIME